MTSLRSCFFRGGPWTGGPALLAFALFAVPSVAVAQTDEIQVYDAEIADQGVFNLMMHTNFTPIGRKTADFPGGIIPNRSVNGTAEWAYGVNSWFEQGLYLPVWTGAVEPPHLSLNIAEGRTQ
jgi:hypothetical protein